MVGLNWQADDAEFIEEDDSTALLIAAGSSLIVAHRGTQITSVTDWRITRSTRTTDKATAKRIANKNEAAAALRRDGVIEPAMEAIGSESQRSVDSHLVDFENKMRAAKRTPKHIRSTTNFVREIANHSGFRAVCDISADGVNGYARMLLDMGTVSSTHQCS